MAILAGAAANWVVLFIGFTIWYNLTEQTALNPAVYAAAWALGLIGVFAGVGLTPAGEAFFRLLQGCRRPIRAEAEKLTPAFEDICRTAKVNPSRYRLFVSDDKFPNAFAIGRRTICVTRSLLTGSTEEELQGVLAHELAHHIHGDAARNIVFFMTSLIGQILMLVGLLIGNILNLFNPSRYLWNGGIISILLSLLISVVVLVLSIAIWLFQIFVWIPIFVVSSFGGRQQEYRADLYTAQLGYSDGLLAFLNRILDLDGRPSGFMGLLYRTHPKTGDRIRRLEDM